VQDASSEQDEFISGSEIGSEEMTDAEIVDTTPLSSSVFEEGYDYTAVLDFVRNEVRQVCAEAIPAQEVVTSYQGVSFGNTPAVTTTPRRELGLPLAQEAHSSLCEIDELITGTDRILGAVVEEYPAALAMGKLVTGAKIVASDSYQTLGATFLLHPAVVSARVKTECQPAPKVNVSLGDLESMEKLSKLIFQVNNHLGTFLFGLDKAIDSFPPMAKGCLVAASKASHHIAQLAGRLMADNILLRSDHYLSGLRATGVVKTYFRCRSVRETLLFGADFNLIMDKEANKFVPAPQSGNARKRRNPAFQAFKPADTKKPRYFDGFQIPRVSEPGWQTGGNAPISLKQGHSKPRMTHFRSFTKSKTPKGGNQTG
jgi:hypothetical protein